MKIYKVLKDCKPFITEGTVMELSLKNNFTDDGIKGLLYNKYIQEPKKEFTEDEMYDFAINYDGESCLRNAIDEWKRKQS